MAKLLKIELHIFFTHQPFLIHGLFGRCQGHFLFLAISKLKLIVDGLLWEKCLNLGFSQTTVNSPFNGFKGTNHFFQL